MRRPITERQTQVYEFIRDYMRAHGTPPTLREIGDGLSIRSSNAVFKLLKALETKGLIVRESGAARGIRIADPDEDPLAETQVPSLPIISRVSSDEPERLRLRPRGALFVDETLLSGYEPETCLIGKASDDGLASEGIWRGDFLVVAQTPLRRLDDGDIVAALVGEALLARQFMRRMDRFMLHAAGRSYDSIPSSDGDPECYVVGRVVSVLRKM
ncbi:MAG: transcriptional repressor LexA [Bacteroidota bacterium]